MIYWTEIEEPYKGFTIYIDENPDAYRGGFEFCISNGTTILEQGLTADLESAFSTAQKWVDDYLIIPQFD
ncbi:hypothetical protein A1OK_12845 [Enterovibrio norvegicus FF-454]|uniref:HicB-like antitoxin of toxin-antitoxin system domain-containing protein n=1 Tax=Enterovibrio norvegicus FF-454 TaxID=1185651 RepID=A0A1E5C387_9GAMM|nr:hypothetical protein [Enterovibrio norvegicus]OEE59969.1 hypothetical protein A1OK_12845 [Enterovibrio norvegicus FF-454]